MSMDMKKIAAKFQNDHLGKGEVSKVTDYSFTYTTLPDKNGKTATEVYYLTWFLNI